MEFQNCFLFSVVHLSIFEITHDSLKHTNCTVLLCKIHDSFVSLPIILVFLRYLVKVSNIKLHKNFS